MSKSEVVEDFLEVDQPIPGQNFVCLSFISPEKILKKKEVFFCKNFLKFYFEKISEKRENEKEITFEELMNPENIEEVYENFLYVKEDELNQKFSEMNNFQTTIRGLKIRGSYDTKREADVRAKVLQKRDPNFNVFVGQVGYWLPWDPNPDNIQEQEYQNDQLNTLMKKYMENRSEKDELFAQETAERKRRAREENKKREFYQEKTEDQEKTNTVKIEELRDIADEKDRLYSGIQKGEAQLDNSKYADPWMERRDGSGDNKNFSSGVSAEEITPEEKDKNLDKIVKDIF